MGTITVDGSLMLCGGHGNKSVLSTCHTLTIGTSSIAQPSMIGREDAAAGWTMDSAKHFKNPNLPTA